MAALVISMVACARTPMALSAPRTPTITAATTQPNSGFEGIALSAECGAPDNPSNLASIEAVDQYTVVVGLCRPDGALLSKLAFPSMAIQSAEHLDSTGGAPLVSVIGTGAYQLDEWKAGEELVMKAFDQYWGDPPAAASLVFRFQADPSARLEVLLAGAADGSVAAGDEGTDLPGMILLDERQPNVLYLGLNRDLPPLDNDWVRRAIALAVDKQALVDDFPPGATAAGQFVPPEIFGYGEEVAGLAFDPEQARLSLDRAGVAGIELTLSYRNIPTSYLPDPVTVAGEIQRQLARVGIRVNLAEMESEEFLEAVDAGELPMYLLGWQATYPDPVDFLDFHFGAQASAQFGSHFLDLEQTLAEAASTSDQTARRDLYSQAARLINRYLPAIPLAHGGAQVAFKEDVAGAYTSTVGSESFAEMIPGDRNSFVWMQSSEPTSLYCADEISRDAFRACGQMLETLVRYGHDGLVMPALAESYTANGDATSWTFNLRRGVVFHDGSDLDANDVVSSFVAQWDSSSPLHVGRTGRFDYFALLFGGFLHTPAG